MYVYVCIVFFFCFCFMKSDNDNDDGDSNCDSLADPQLAYSRNFSLNCRYLHNFNAISLRVYRCVCVCICSARFAAEWLINGQRNQMSSSFSRFDHLWRPLAAITRSTNAIYNRGARVRVKALLRLIKALFR